MLQDELEKINVDNDLILKFIKDIFNYKNIFELVKSNFYVFSFSTEDDDLSQWRAYGDDGGGYCIEFDFVKTRKLAAEKDLIRFKCIYDIKKQKKMIRDIIDKTLATCNKINKLIESKYEKSDVTVSEEDKLLQDIRGKFVRKLGLSYFS